MGGIWTAMGDPVRDVTPLPDLLHGRSHTGPVRERRPVYVDLLPPCNAGCPAGENIQAWLSHTKAGRHERRGASSPRTTRCLRSMGGSVTTRARASVTARASTAPSRFTRSSGSWATSRWSAAGVFDPPAAGSGKRVLVIGAGPSGLSAAYHLARLGHEVEIRDAGDETGGMMRYGIPAYRLPRDVLSGEIDRIEAMGVRDDLRSPGRGSRRRTRGGPLRRGLRRRRRAPLEARRHPRRRRGQDRRRRLVPAQRRIR